MPKKKKPLTPRLNQDKVAQFEKSLKEAFGFKPKKKKKKKH